MGPGRPVDRPADPTGAEAGRLVAWWCGQSCAVAPHRSSGPARQPLGVTMALRVGWWASRLAASGAAVSCGGFVTAPVFANHRLYNTAAGSCLAQ
ncbi:hypothetical protein NDU88_006487 [Pleurodeles waltl]|uniref:Uncharacterized protein n=1 Tax=Pleurodeles waltl TaxID=8319 RepID=A0AAV7WEV5_PLEWA|nr:hypothetical protein NDU88_006487 [Pleurodeles waltl]